MKIFNSCVGVDIRSGNIKSDERKKVIKYVFGKWSRSGLEPNSWRIKSFF
jgi:hypothetical protein